jgi:isopentenyl diphosphate isomerase/L-lactate dehydrogenase-like FMN-dependent dehydrogenase
MVFGGPQGDVMPIDVRAESRRHFLRFLAGSPLLYGLGGSLAALAARAQDDSVLSGSLAFDGAITSPAQAVNVWDFENALRARLNAGHFAYMAQGSDDLGTIAANRAGFAKIGLRPQRLVDIASVDLSVSVFGQPLSSPIFLCPVGAQLMFHPEGEVAVARAAKAKNALQVLSTVTNYSVEDVAAARGGPGWFQLYTTSDWPSTLGMLKRAEDAGCTAVAWTVDIPARNLEAVARFDRDRDPVCQACHAGMPANAFEMRRMFDGVDMTNVRLGLAGLSWNFVDRLKGATKMKVLLKGIQTREDAARCLEHGADGIVVSNHGGRADETLRATIDCLPEVIAAVRGRVPVFVDSGFRRGTDIFKALALGATAVGVGRPYIWGLGSFGQPGVERVLDILNRELRIVMQQMGAARIADISRSSLEL